MSSKKQKKKSSRIYNARRANGRQNLKIKMYYSEIVAAQKKQAEAGITPKRRGE